MLRSLTTATCALAALAGGVAGGAPHAGKVVRVERPAGKLAGAPRFCRISADRTGQCYGPKPERGEHLVMLDNRGPIATLRVSAVHAVGKCAPPEMWSIETQLERGARDNASDSDEDRLALLDVETDPRRARLVDVDRMPGDRELSADSVTGVDSDGDGTADLAFLWFRCGDDGEPTTDKSISACIEAWYAVGGRWERLRVDRLHLDCL